MKQIQAIRLTLLLGLVFSMSPVFSQKTKRVLELNESKRYELYFIDVALTDNEEDDTTQLKTKFKYDTTKSYFVDDQRAIWNLRDKWTGIPTDQMYLCWYHYFIYLVEDGKIIDELRVNTECSQVVSNRGVFDFESFPFDNLNTSKTITVIDINFKSIEQGRAFIKSLESQKDIFIPELAKTAWIQFDGEFTIETPYKKGSRIKKELTKYFNERNPGHKFEISCTGVMGGTLLYTITCNKQLADSFSLYKIDRPWEPLTVGPLRLFSKNATSIKQLSMKFLH